MKSHHKNILLLFSLALNIGFIITTVAGLYKDHIRPHYRRHFQQFVEALNDLNIPSSEKAEALDAIEKLHNNFSSHKDRLRKMRIKSFDILARSGPIDTKRLEAFDEEAVDLVVQIHQRIGNDLLELRRLLGNEKGAEFFSILLKRMRSEPE